MSFDEQIPRKYPSREEMRTRVARFKDLKGFDGGLPDSYMPAAERILYNVIGFQPPESEEAGFVSPVGAKAARMSAIKITEGFNLAYCEAKPGKGPMMHNHDTNETFVVMTGRWRASWENADGSLEHEDLDPLDTISFPPGAIRRFENVTDGPADEYSVLMVIISGDSPGAEFTREAMTEIEGAGVLDQYEAGVGGDDWVKPHTDASRIKVA